jgi:hypothetical protein
MLTIILKGHSDAGLKNYPKILKHYTIGDEEYKFDLTNEGFDFH